MLGKRKNRSKASKDSMPSPDEKKSKDEAKAHSTASETDEVFEALEMAEGVGSKLEAVLKKIRKAWYYWEPFEQDAHNTSKYWRKCKQAGFGSRRSQNKVQTAWLNSQWSKFNEEDISDSKLENKKIQQDVCELQKQLLYMETYSRRENVKFAGLLEEQVDNMNGGDEDHNSAKAQIEDTRGIININFSNINQRFQMREKELNSKDFTA